MNKSHSAESYQKQLRDLCYYFIEMKMNVELIYLIYVVKLSDKFALLLQLKKVLLIKKAYIFISF